MSEEKNYIVGVVGNPNCGKTTVFNALTGSKQRVGNWPGVTVDRKTGFYTHDAKDIELVDLPGIYSLDIAPGHTSVDEEIAQNYTLSGEADLIVNILDASNLERNLYLTTQLLDMGVPMLVVLNMMDVVREQGSKLDAQALEKQLGAPVLLLSASRNEGIEELREKINQCAAEKIIATAQVSYIDSLETAVNKLSKSLEPHLEADQAAHIRWFTLKLLEGDAAFTQAADAEVVKQAESLRDAVEVEYEEDIDILIADARYSFIGNISDTCLHKSGHFARSLSDKIDHVVLNRVLGIPIFLLVMYLMFMFTINLGGAFIDFFDMFTGTLLVDGMAHVLGGWGMPEWISTFVANGIGGGIQVVATFIPVIAFLFLFMSFLEDSGYMARAAFVMDRFMRAIGLPGKSFVPMLVGFGCNVPAIMATRTLENERDRHLTVLMNPFMSCGARLPVYALFAAAFFPTNGQNLVFGLYLLGMVVAILTGLIMKHTLLRGEAGHFVMELPAYHMPTFKGVILRTWDCLKGFIVRAGKIIVPMVIVISFLNAWGTDGTFGNDNTDKSVLSEIGRTLTPAFEPMGIEEDNWPATVGVFTGVLAKEVVVGTLDAIYEQLGAAEAAKNGGVAEEAGFDLWGGISEAFATIPANLIGITETLLDPLGISIGDVSSLDTAAAEQEVSNTTFGAMQARFDGAVGAFAYLLFILMYFPCTAATAAIYRETGVRWAVFVAAWTTGIGYMTAVIFYQSATFMRHPTQSIAWISGLLIVFACVLVLLRIAGNKRKPVIEAIPATETAAT